MKLNFEDVDNAMGTYGLLPGSFASSEGVEYIAHTLFGGKPQDWLTIYFTSPAGQGGDFSPW
jgi:hypothetical protein